jgi:hypothetical protein
MRSGSICINVNARLLSLPYEADSAYSLKVVVLGPESRVIFLRCRIDNAVSQWQLVSEPCNRGRNRQIGVEIDDPALAHESNRLKRITLAALPRDNLENFGNADRGHYEGISVLYRIRE